VKLASETIILPNCNYKNITLQHRAWAYLRTAANRLLSDRKYRKYSILPEDIRLQCAGLGSYESLCSSLDLANSDIRVVGEELIIPNVIAGKLITGFWCFTPDSNVSKYYTLLPGGLAFSFTLEKTLRDDHVIDGLFVFQDILEALDYLTNVFTKTGRFYPIVAHTQLDLLKNITWLPQCNIYLIVNSVQPQLLRHLSPLNPNIVLTSAGKRFVHSPLRLAIYAKKAVPLAKLLPNIIGLTKQTGILVSGGKWWYYPSGSLALNADLTVQQILRHKRTYIYVCTLSINNTQLHPRIVGKGDFYTKLATYCLQNNQILFCAPSLRKHLIDVAIANTGKTKVIPIQFGYNKRQKAFRTYTLYITPDTVSEERLSEKKAPGALLLPKKLPPAPFPLNDYSRGQANQLTLLCALFLAIAAQFSPRPRRFLVFLSRAPIEFDAHIFESLGIPKYDQLRPQLTWWPQYVTHFPQQHIAATDALPIATGDSVQLAYSLMQRPILYVHLTENYLPLLTQTQLNDALVWWIQRQLRNRQILYLDHNFKYLLTDFLRMFVPSAQYQQWIQTHLLGALSPRKDLGIYLLVAEFFKQGYLTQADKKTVRPKQCIVSVERLNSILMGLGYAPILESTEDGFVSLDIPQLTKIRMSPLSALSRFDLTKLMRFG